MTTQNRLGSPKAVLHDARMRIAGLVTLGVGALLVVVWILLSITPYSSAFGDNCGSLLEDRSLYLSLTGEEGSACAGPRATREALARASAVLGSAAVLVGGFLAVRAWDIAKNTAP